jgi:hypothetical protein
LTLYEGLPYNCENFRTFFAASYLLLAPTLTFFRIGNGSLLLHPVLEQRQFPAPLKRIEAVV